MFVVEVGTVLTMILTIRAMMGAATAVPISYLLSLDFWLFFTVLFANFATALAEARGKAHKQGVSIAPGMALCVTARPGA